MHYLCMQGLALVILVWFHSKDARAARLHVSKGHAVDNRQMSLVNGLGMRPPMGWNSWNHFQCNVNEDIIKQTADALISTGLARSGYEYINIDDCWAELGRDNQGNLASRSSSFPSGIKAVADYVHSKGLKIGIYSDAGYQTCAGQPGSLGHETQDANTFASWGIDYLKYDNCNNDGSKPEVRYPVMRDALLQTGRPIFYSLCEWGQDQPSVWAPGVGNSWRTTGDISDQWDSMMSNAEENNQWARYAGPGRWNDPDMLEVGNGNMTIEEYRVHFSLWSLMKAPLLLGCDLRNISRMYIEMLSNSEVISINQDPLGVQGRLVKRQGQVEVWAGPLSDKRIAVVLLNRGMTWATIRVTWEDVHFDKGTVVLVRDVWLHHDLSGVSVNSFQTEVENHTCKMYVMKPI